MSRHGLPLHHNNRPLGRRLADLEPKHPTDSVAKALGVAPAPPVAVAAVAAGAPVPGARQPARLLPEASCRRHASGMMPSRRAWPREKKLAFNALEPAALCLVATDGPVSVVLWGPGGEQTRLGHNRGIWPARVVKTGAWKDSVTTSWDKNPFMYLGVQIRLWAPTVEERDRVSDAVLALIAARSEEHGGLARLEHGFADLGPELDLALFEVEIRDIAERARVRVWDDDELSAWLDGVTATAVARARAAPVTVPLLDAVIGRALDRKRETR